jgi:hypothetical protein
MLEHYASGSDKIRGRTSGSIDAVLGNAGQ